MKQRVLTAIVLLIFLGVVLFFYHTLFFHLVISAIAAIAVFELLWPTGYLKNKFLVAISVAYAFIAPFFATHSIPHFSVYVTIAYFVILFAVLLLRHNEVPFQGIATAFFVSLAIPIAFSSLILIREEPHNLFYTLLICVGAWVCDSGAYFVGRAFGKHKMAPQISPNKTIEGGIGGVLTTMVMFLLFCFGYQWIQARYFDTVLSFNIWYVLLLSVICAFIGMVGDLLASVVKRQTGIKDFGHIMPGHGGIMDRFDSFLLVAPTLYMIVRMLPIF